MYVALCMNRRGLQFFRDHFHELQRFHEFRLARFVQCANGIEACPPVWKKQILRGFRLLTMLPNCTDFECILYTAALYDGAADEKIIFKIIVRCLSRSRDPDCGSVHCDSCSASSSADHQLPGPVNRWRWRPARFSERHVL